MESEILTGEVFLRPVNTQAATAEIDAELAEIEESLKNYNCTASSFDYAVAVISGILSGAIDAFLVKDTAALFAKDDPPLTDQIGRIIDILMNKSGTKKPTAAVNKMMFAGKGKEKPAVIQALEVLAKHRTSLGIAASCLVRLWECDVLVFDDIKPRINFQDKSKQDITLLFAAIAVVGILKWLDDISSENVETGRSGEHSGILDKIRELIHSSPRFQDTVRKMDDWLKKLPKEMEGLSRQNKSGMGAETFTYSLLACIGLPAALMDRPFVQTAVNEFKKAEKLGLEDVPIVQALKHQTFPVLINEIMVRSMFFATRLARELLADGEVSDIDWQKILPFGNRDVERMMTIASMTLSVADTADAAVHAAMEAAGSFVAFAGRFVARYNYVAAGRAMFALIREVSGEQEKAELIRRQQILSTARSMKAVEVLIEYQKQLEERVSTYLAEDLEAFMEGIVCMDQGMAEGNSDLVIQGNVTIQRILGHEVQFTNQQEFDDLMDSDIPLKL